MNKRTRSRVWPAILVVAATTSGCANHQQMAVTTGIIVAAAGAVVIVGHRASLQCDDCSFDLAIEYATRGKGDLIGGAMIAGGVASIIGGLISSILENRPLARTPSAVSPAPTASAGSPDAPPSAGPRADLAVQLGVEARVGHCQVAVAIARRLMANDAAALVLAAIKRDTAVARCLGYKM